jgi:hypothetical protein
LCFASLQADGILSKMIYNNSNQAGVAGVGGRIKVAGTTITNATIKISTILSMLLFLLVLNGSEQPLIYAPRSHKQLIVAANNVLISKPFDADAQRTFTLTVLKLYSCRFQRNSYRCFKIALSMCTDLVADINTVQLDKIALNREDMFIKKQHDFNISRSKSKIQRIVRRIITSNEGRLVSPLF